ncbi:uncharacterized protein LOC110051860 [Orbicella faveolata]|uniref:uncharacterized protein LOC110051860 n=1 Tax=Orbicella faveolata TaxID=48498 RepID=UPI0009E58321|nr:uncharacterized protein LOC110051860 [Orbicella faveolata]
MNEDPEGAQLIQDIARPQFRRILINLVLPGFPPLCVLFQLFRLASLVMFSMFLFDCILYHDTTSVDCTYFTVYNTPPCDPYCWKTVWLVCSILTSTVFICLLNRTMLPELRPVRNKVVLKSLIRMPYFWSLNTTTALAVLYDALIMIQNKKAKISIECLEIVSKPWTLCLLYQLNFTFPPCTQRGFRRISRAAYCITLSIYVLDNLSRFAADTAQVAFKFYTINRDLPKPLTIINLMLMIINASVYYNFMQFFWKKLFRDDKEILKVFKQKFVDSKGIKEFVQNGNPE